MGLEVRTKEELGFETRGEHQHLRGRCRVGGEGMRPDKGEEQIHEGKNTGLRVKGKKREREREREPYHKGKKKKKQKEENSRVESTPRPASALNMSGWVG
eukprot:3881608-Rhodomonas_salina.1